MLLKWLGLAGDDTATQPDAVQHIEQELSHLPPDRARYLATMAYLLSRAADADSKTSDEEVHLMERILIAEGHLPPDQAALVVEMAQHAHEIFGGTDNLEVARQFAEVATHAEKLLLLECLFAVCAADDSIITAEDNEVRRISRELKISHQEFIEVRQKFKRYLATLKGIHG